LYSSISSAIRKLYIPKPAAIYPYQQEYLAFAAIGLAGIENNIYVQVALIMLIGLPKMPFL
jgi:hypothetical protein